MGGSLILFALVIPTLLVVRSDQPLRLADAAASPSASASIGFLDDYLKLTRTKKGMPRQARSWPRRSSSPSAAVVYLFYSRSLRRRSEAARGAAVRRLLQAPDLALWLPAVHGARPCRDRRHRRTRVNITDGLDGLAIGPVIFAAGDVPDPRLRRRHRDQADFNIAEYLKIPYIHGSGELAIFCGAMVGAGIGFLWFNTYPAAVFMGDVGSLSLGGALGMLAVLTKNEFTLVICRRRVRASRR